MNLRIFQLFIDVVQNGLQAAKTDCVLIITTYIQEKTLATEKVTSNDLEQGSKVVKYFHFLSFLHFSSDFSHSKDGNDTKFGEDIHPYGPYTMADQHWSTISSSTAF